MSGASSDNEYSASPKRQGVAGQNYDAGKADRPTGSAGRCTMIVAGTKATKVGIMTRAENNRTFITAVVVGSAAAEAGVTCRVSHTTRSWKQSEMVRGP